jgi:hypothetical protein
MPATLPGHVLAAVRSTAARPPLAVGVAVLALLAVGALVYSDGVETTRVEGARRESAPSYVQQQCMEAAMLFHDVRWASACSDLAEQGQSDGNAECDLPNARAGRLYALLRQAEQECRAEARLAPAR